MGSLQRYRQRSIRHPTNFPKKCHHNLSDMGVVFLLVSNTAARQYGLFSWLGFIRYGFNAWHVSDTQIHILCNSFLSKDLTFCFMCSSCSFDALTTTLSNKSYIMSCCCFFYFFPILVISGCYFFIVQAVFKHEDEMRQQAKKMNVTSLRNSSEQNQVSAEIRIAKVAIINVSLWILAWTPFCVFFSTYLTKFNLSNLSLLSKGFLSIGYLGWSFRSYTAALRIAGSFGKNIMRVQSNHLLLVSSQISWGRISIFLNQTY